LKYVFEKRALNVALECNPHLVVTAGNAGDLSVHTVGSLEQPEFPLRLVQLVKEPIGGSDVLG
jgi:hypothetical protein